MKKDFQHLRNLRNYLLLAMSDPPRKRLKPTKASTSRNAPSSAVNENESKKKGKMEEDFLGKIISSRITCSPSIAEFNFNKKRIRMISEQVEVSENNNGIVYWMSRDQRVQDNWAFLCAQRLALKYKVPLHVCFCLVPKFLDTTIRHYNFMLKGLKEVEQECKLLGISFHLLIGYAKNVLHQFVRDHNIKGIVTDFAPLRVPLQWVEDVKHQLPKDVPFCQVDAHNIVPCWEASPKQEYAARTIRNKIYDKLNIFLTEFPPVVTHPYPPIIKAEHTDWDSAESSLEVDRSVEDVDWAEPGSAAGLRMLEEFCNHRLKGFFTDRNNPNKDGLSKLSPWTHFGQLSMQRCILVVKSYRNKFKESVDAYIEEAIIRRELADNFCYYNKNYDKVEGATDWAQTTLEAHAKDKRDYIYTREEFEKAKTHDDLWNAAQLQMVNEGKMHGFLRMYWAKKILEWTSTPEEALSLAIWLNDKYELDGRDPNGYVGCMWSICGIHDQAWGERPVFGKIRFMNYAGCKRKFNVENFVRKYGAICHHKK